MRKYLHALIASLISIAALNSTSAAPKRVLVVTTTMGFRHSSIPTAEKVLAQLSVKSRAFTVDFARVDPDDPRYRGADGKPDKAKVDAAIKAVLAEKMSLAALQKYDGVIFANTTGGKQSGDLPLPDKQGFLNWIKAGHAFIGMHSATDTFRGYEPLDPYVEMIGAEFKQHGAQAVVDCINQDPNHPACCELGPTFHLKDEIYLMNGFDRSKVHGLLTLDKHPNDKTPGDFPISWCKEYGDGKLPRAEHGAQLLTAKKRPGRIFYTSLGHREDVWDPDTPENYKRENPPEVAIEYQKHILGGIKWALGLQESCPAPLKK